MKRKKILLVDDSNTILMMEKFILRNHSYEIVTASDGEEGVRKALEHRPDLVLLDLIMPKLQGFEVLKALKADPGTATIPVVVLSAVARERPIGAAAFLRKPIPLQKFFDTIKGFVEAGLPRPGLASS